VHLLHFYWYYERYNVVGDCINVLIDAFNNETVAMKLINGFILIN